MSRSRPLSSLLALVLAGGALEASAATVTEICTLPRPGNNGKVLGHDVGWSTVHAGYSYFFFGDTYVDKNNNGIWDGSYPVGPDKFVPGTILARTNDPNPDDCLSLTYKVQGGEAAPLIPVIANETYVWPAGAVSFGSSFYTYYQSWESFPGVCDAGHCRQAPGAPCAPKACPAPPATCDKYLEYRGTGLARINVGTSVSSTTATRVGGYVFGPEKIPFSSPIEIAEATGCGVVKYTYLFGHKQLGCYGPYEVYLARVPSASIEDPTKVQYWGNQGTTHTWTNSYSAAIPIFSGPYVFTFGVAYDQSVGRYLATYSCGFLASKTCVAWAGVTGTASKALTSVWTPSELLTCPGGDGFDCYQAREHPQYASGSVTYMTGAKNSDGDYWVNLRKVDFGPGF